MNVAVELLTLQGLLKVVKIQKDLVLYQLSMPIQ